MTVVADDLLAWLASRLDAEEQLALAATSGPWVVVNRTSYGMATVNGPDAMQDGGADPATGGRRQELRPLVVIFQDVDYGPTVRVADAEHIAAWNPARALLRVQAARRILQAHGDQHECVDLSASAYPYVGCQTVRLLGAEYQDQPGYRPQWAPTP